MPSNELYAYSHCKKGALQICHNEVPNDCTICGNVIDSFLVPPYTLKTPLSTSVPHSVMLRSADRSLDGYLYDQKLHIGIVSGSGLIFSFEEGGIRMEKEKWNNGITIYMASDEQKCLWGSVLAKISNEFMDTKYHDKKNNCFNFVTSFLMEIDNSIKNEMELCEYLIKPSVIKVIRYLSYCENLTECGKRRNDYFVKDEEKDPRSDFENMKH